MSFHAASVAAQLIAVWTEFHLLLKCGITFNFPPDHIRRKAQSKRSKGCTKKPFVPILPPDVLQMVFLEADSRTVAACSLVCRLWSLHASSILFYRRVLSADSSRYLTNRRAPIFSKFARDVQRSPRLATNLRALTIREIRVDIALLDLLLESLVNLSWFRLFKTSFRRLQSPFTSRCRSKPRKLSMLSIHAGGASMPLSQCLSDVLALLDEIEHLYLYDTGVSQSLLLQQVPRRSIRIHLLTTASPCPMEIFEVDALKRLDLKVALSASYVQDINNMLQQLGNGMERLMFRFHNELGGSTSPGVSEGKHLTPAAHDTETLIIPDGAASLRFLDFDYTFACSGGLPAGFPSVWRNSLTELGHAFLEELTVRISLSIMRQWAENVATADDLYGQFLQMVDWSLLERAVSRCGHLRKVSVVLNIDLVSLGDSCRGNNSLICSETTPPVVAQHFWRNTVNMLFFHARVAEKFLSLDSP